MLSVENYFINTINITYKTTIIFIMDDKIFFFKKKII